jgi:hypothetical protein
MLFVSFRHLRVSNEPKAHDNPADILTARTPLRNPRGFYLFLRPQRFGITIGPRSFYTTYDSPP